MSEWNLRKHNRRAAIRETTLKLFKEHQVSIAVIDSYISLCQLNLVQFLNGNEKQSQLAQEQEKHDVPKRTQQRTVYTRKNKAKNATQP